MREENPNRLHMMCNLRREVKITIQRTAPLQKTSKIRLIPITRPHRVTAERQQHSNNRRTLVSWRKVWHTNPSTMLTSTPLLSIFLIKGTHCFLHWHWTLTLDINHVLNCWQSMQTHHYHPSWFHGDFQSFFSFFFFFFWVTLPKKNCALVSSHWNEPVSICWPPSSSIQFTTDREDDLIQRSLLSSLSNSAECLTSIPPSILQFRPSPSSLPLFSSPPPFGSG